MPKNQQASTWQEVSCPFGVPGLGRAGAQPISIWVSQSFVSEDRHASEEVCELAPQPVDRSG